jgi:uncharacterized repeat protein (TIGR03803 family)
MAYYTTRERSDGPVRFMLLVALAVFTVGGASGQSPVYATLYSFKGGADGLSPHAGVVLGENGALYGTTYEGGTGSLGTAFLLVPSTGGSWQKAVLHNFSGPDGSLPAASLVFTGNGALYGTTQEGGTGNNGGTVFELTPPSVAGGAWIENVSYSFGGGCDNLHAPYSAVTTGPGGALFGTVSGSNCDSPTPTGGAVFMLTPSSAPGGIWTEHTLLNFWPPTGIGFTPFAGVVFSQGSLFGTVYYSGVDSGCGSVYELSPEATAWTGTTIYNFGEQPGDGCGSLTALTVGPAGVLYGTTWYGGSGVPCNVNTGGCGTVFQLTPPTMEGGSWTETVIYSFTGVSGDGAYPSAGVVIGQHGVLYGTTEYGGSATSASPCSFYGATGCGTVFQLTPPTVPGGTWTETILHSFTGQNGDGSIPMAGLARSSSGVLYGTASAGGTAGKGTVFSVTP